MLRLFPDMPFTAGKNSGAGGGSREKAESKKIDVLPRQRTSEIDWNVCWDKAAWERKALVSSLVGVG